MASRNQIILRKVVLHVREKLDGMVNTDGVLGVICARKRHGSLSAFITIGARYLAYLLSVVLILLLVFLIFKAVILSPVGGHNPEISALAVSAVPEEEPMSDTAAIYPKTAVYYHGVRLGEYEGEEATVAEVMGQFNIILSSNDVTNYGIDDPVFYGMTLCIDEVYYDDVVIDHAIPYDVVEIESHNIPKGTRQVQREGVMGSNQQVVRNKYVNGELVEESASFERVISPVNEEVLVGVGGVFTAPDGKEYNYSYYLDVTATAYTHTGDPTYMGTEAKVGVIAVDPRNIALGSDVYVIGNYGDYGLCRAEDIGGGIKGKRIDVFLDTEEECVRFGRRKMRANVIE